MDFYEAQAAARTRSTRLVLLFAAAVASLIVVSVVLVLVLLEWQAPGAATPTEQTQLALGVAGLVIAVVLVASLGRRASLAGGGRTVAESLGGRLVPSATRVPEERQLLNVVEEMAIAAGIPVPPVYLLDDDAINAFAAGYAPEDAVIGITRGALAVLDRNELQGVIGHEFSHVLNGDMRLNIRLVALLFGIIVLAQLGRMLLYARGRGKEAGAIVMIGLGFVILGFTGHFFGRLIQAAVSRQREFLADASAVQFTRDPDGIAGALRKIGGASAGSRLGDARSDEMSHMFFGAVREQFGALGATHPPLADRIRAIDPAWDGSFPTVSIPAPRDGAAPPTPRGSDRTGALAASSLAGEIGQVSPAHVDDAQALIAALPTGLVACARDPADARALILALLLPEAPDAAVGALAELEPTLGTKGSAQVLALHRQRAAIAAGGRVTLTRMAAPALKALSTPQYRTFVADVLRLIRLDGRVDVFEWALHQLLLQELAPHFDGVTRQAQSARLRDLRMPVRTVLATLAFVGGEDDSQARAALAAGLRALDDADGTSDATSPPLSQLSDAVRRLRALQPLERPTLLKAAVICVEHDGVVQAAEYELLVGIAAALDCPLPSGFGHLLQR